MCRSLPLVTLILALSLPAGAEEKPDYAAAKRHFKAGQEFLQMDRYAEAVVEFKQAYEITKDGLVMGQVAEAYAKAGDYEAALAAINVYHDALAEGERGPARELQREYAQAIQEGRSKKLVLPTDEKPRAEEKGTEETIAAPVVPEEKPRRKGRLYTWIVAGGAGAFALSALVVGLNAQSKYDELQDTCKPRCPDSEVDSVKTRALVADILWGVAGAAAITAGVLFFLEGRSSKGSEKHEPAEGEDELVRRRLRLAPMVGGGTYGVNAGLKF